MESTLYKYSINGVDYSDALGGAMESAESIERLFNNAQIDSNIRLYNESQLSFTGKAYDYICSHLDDTCFKFDVVLSNAENYTITGTFYSYMVTVDVFKRIANTQLKDMSWSSVLRNRTANKIYTASKVTINCEPLISLTRHSVPMFGTDGTQEGSFKTGFNAIDVINYMVKYLTNNQMSVVSPFLEANPIIIFNGAQITPFNPFIPFEAPTQSETYIFASLDDILTPIRKIYGLDMDIIGNVIYLLPTDDTFIDEQIYEISNVPIDTTFTTDSARLFSSVKLGSTAQMLDISDEDNEPYISFRSTMINGFSEQFLNACNCELDKSNELDLSYDIITDPNLIHKALVEPETISKTEIVFVEGYWNGGFLHPKSFFSPNTGRYYYNDTFLFINVMSRWGDTIANCVYSPTAFEEIYRSQCGGFLETEECANPYNLFLPGTGNYKGFMYWINPNQVSPPPFDTDSTDIYNGWLANPSPGTHEQSLVNPDGYSGYVVPFTGWYAFTAESYLATSLPRNNLTARFSIVVYEDDTLLVEVYRVTETKNYGAIPNLSDTFEVSTDAILLNAGNVVMVQTDIDIDSPTPSIGQITWDGISFFYDTSRIGCIDYRTDPNTRPYVYEFDYPICLEDFEYIKENRLGYILLDNKKCWISKITRTLTGETILRLVSNDVICKPCND